MKQNASKNTDLYKSEALDIASVAKRVREAIFKHDNFKFCGDFTLNCLKDCQSEVVDFYIMGHHSRVRKLDSQECLTAGQIILFNTKKAPEKDQQKLRHSLVSPSPFHCIWF